MDRRQFLKLAAMTGVSLMTPTLRGGARADEKKRYPGPYFLMVHCSGGWDPTYVCDPKGDPINRVFPKSRIGTAGNLRFAPIEYQDGGGATYFSNAQFFEKHQSRLLVLNGLDTTTGNHDTGTRNVWSGSVGEGYPTFAALVAAAKTPGNPLGFISSGGYENTAGVTSLTRLGNVDAVARIAYPNRIDPNNPASGFHTEATYQRIATMQRERLQDLRNAQALPRLQKSMSTLYLARSGDSALADLAHELPGQSVVNQSNSSLHRQAMVAIAGFKAGLAVAANLVIGGYDTHGNHDGAHLPRIYDLLHGLDLTIGEIAKQGLDGKVVIVVGSDFGRTPMYNAQAGKDHWNITSMMFMGPGIPGNRVVGATDDGFRATTVHRSTLQLDPGGLRIRCDHVQKALRKLTGIEASEPARGFPLNAEDLPLFAA